MLGTTSTTTKKYYFEYSGNAPKTIYSICTSISPFVSLLLFFLSLFRFVRANRLDMFEKRPRRTARLQRPACLIEWTVTCVGYRDHWRIDWTVKNMYVCESILKYCIEHELNRWHMFLMNLPANPEESKKRHELIRSKNCNFSSIVHSKFTLCLSRNAFQKYHDA